MANPLQSPPNGIDITKGTGFRWLVNLYQLLIQTYSGSIAGGANITLTGSGVPFNIQLKGTLWVKGGTVSAITQTRSGTVWTLGVTSGAIPVSMNDAITITYSSTPTVFLIPI